MQEEDLALRVTFLLSDYLLIVRWSITNVTIVFFYFSFTLMWSRQVTGRSKAHIETCASYVHAQLFFSIITYCPLSSCLLPFVKHSDRW